MHDSFPREIFQKKYNPTKLQDFLWIEKAILVTALIPELRSPGF
jgi:hypothetical protein